MCSLLQDKSVEVRQVVLPNRKKVDVVAAMLNNFEMF
jgi:hypothetical protein